jgi:hypothetical protein
MCSDDPLNEIGRVLVDTNGLDVEKADGSKLFRLGVKARSRRSMVDESKWGGNDNGGTTDA